MSKLETVRYRWGDREYVSALDAEEALAAKDKEIALLKKKIASLVGKEEPNKERVHTWPDVERYAGGPWSTTLHSLYETFFSARSPTRREAQIIIDDPINGEPQPPTVTPSRIDSVTASIEGLNPPEES